MALTNAEKQARWRQRHDERRRTVARITNLLTRQRLSVNHIDELARLICSVFGRASQIPTLCRLLREHRERRRRLGHNGEVLKSDRLYVRRDGTAISKSGDMIHFYDCNGHHTWSVPNGHALPPVQRTRRRKKNKKLPTERPTGQRQYELKLEKAREIKTLVDSGRTHTNGA